MADGEVRRDSLRPGGFARTPELYADLCVSELVRAWATQIPDAIAFVTAERSMTWREYDRFAEDKNTGAGSGAASSDRPRLTDAQAAGQEGADRLGDWTPSAS